MFTLTMSTKGQFTLPKEVREALNLQPGTRVQGVVDEEGRVILYPVLHEPEELFQDRPPVHRLLSLEEMEEAIARATADGRA